MCLNKIDMHIKEQKSTIHKKTNITFPHVIILGFEIGKESKLSIFCDEN